MPESKRSLKVFPSTGSGHRLCHAHGDKNTVRDLYLRLKKDGVDAWLDKEKLLPGQGFDRLNLSDWGLEIRKAARG